MAEAAAGTEASRRVFARSEAGGMISRIIPPVAVREEAGSRAFTLWWNSAEDGHGRTAGDPHRRPGAVGSAAMERLPPPRHRRARHHLGARRARSDPGRLGGGGTAAEPAAASDRRAGRPHRHGLSYRRPPRLAVLRPSDRPARPQEALQRHARPLSG